MEDYMDIDEMMKYETFDHVVICTPAETHYKIVKKMLKAGMNVFCEKPLALTSKETGSLLVSATGKLQVGMIERYNPIVQEIKKKHGKHLTFVREGPKQRHIKENIIQDTAIHDIDLALWFFDELPINLEGEIAKNYSEMTLQFKSGNTATIITAWNRPKNRCINGRSIETSEDILKAELKDYIQGNIISFEAYDVQNIVDECNKANRK